MIDEEACTSWADSRSGLPDEASQGRTFNDLHLGLRGLTRKRCTPPLWLILCAALLMGPPMSNAADPLNAGGLATDAEDNTDQARTDLQIVKSRTVELLAGGSNDGHHGARAQAALDDRVEQILATPQPDLSWDGPEDAAFNQRLDRYLAQTRTLAEGWASDGRFAGDGRVLARVIGELDHALDNYNSETPRPGNWYYWVIPIPDKLGAIGLLTESALPAPLWSKLMASLTHQLKKMNLSGANAAWEARNHAYLALLRGDTQRLRAAADRTFATVRYSSDGGVREDFSYLFHGHIPYAGVYGAGFAETVAQFMYLYDGTRWAPSAGRRELLVQMLLEHYRWMIVGGVWDPIVNGRVYASRRRAHQGLTAMLYMTRVSHGQSQRLRGAVAALLAEGMSVETEVAAFADALANVAPQPVAGFRYWYTAETGVWAGADYHVSFRQFSRRVQDYEFLNRTGPEGWNLAYGFTHISRTGNEWFDGPRGAQPVEDIDWEHLAGTTSRIGAHPINDDTSPSSKGHSLNFGRSEIAGGVGLGGGVQVASTASAMVAEGDGTADERAGAEATPLDNGGLAGFVLLPTHGEFVAHKSLTFFPGGFVALGSGISSQAAATEDRPVHTTLLQWVAPDGETPLIVDGSAIDLSSEPVQLPQTDWCFIDGVGVVLLAPTDLYARRRGRVTTLWIDHGADPASAAYAYAILPSTTQHQVQAFATDRPVQVLHQDAMAHVVAESITGSRGATFFTAGAAAGFAADSPAIIYLRGDDESGAVAVQDAMHRTATLNVNLPVSPATVVLAVDESVEIRTRAPDLSLRVQGKLGRVVRAGWGETSTRLQSMPRADLADFYAFRADVETDSERAVFTVYLGKEPLSEGYELQLEGRKGHSIHTFTEADVVDRPAPGVVRYAWRHGQLEAGSTDDDGQREGDFRLLLYTELKMATAYVRLPHFDADGQPHPSDLPPDANRTPD